VVGTAAACSTISIIARHLGAGVDDRLAHLRRHGDGEVLAAGAERLAQREHAPAAVDDRHAAPDRQRLAGGADGGVEVTRPRQRDAGEHLAVAGLVTSSVSDPEDGVHAPAM
jgi:hypothetical protein